MSLLAEARRLADEVLFPAAMRVDTADRVPAGHLDLLAEHGFYALAGPPSLSGLDGSPGEVVETLASGCLATAFVWIQHHGAVRAVTHSPLSDTWLEPLCRGRLRAGIALGALRPGPPSVRARRVHGGYVFDGVAPWVTGWEMIDVLHTAARDESDTIVWALLDAATGATLTVEPLELAAVNASRTVTVRFDGHLVPDERITGALPYRHWPERDAAGLGFNGRLALGVTSRCCRLAAELGGDPAAGVARLRAELGACRAMLDEDDPGTLPAARAAAAELALRAAATLVVGAGARSVLRVAHPQRLLREAMFLLVFGSRPAIRNALLTRLDRPAAASPEAAAGPAGSWLG